MMEQTQIKTPKEAKGQFMSIVVEKGHECPI
jgi:hypothetical protein